MRLWFLTFVVIHVAFSGIYLTVSSQFTPKLKGFSDSTYYSIQTLSRVGDGQFTATGTGARILTMLQIYFELIWFVLTLSRRRE